MELIDSKKLYRANLARVKSLVSYIEDGEWETATGADCPTMVLVTETQGYANRMKIFVEDELSPDDDKLIIESAINLTLDDPK